MDKRRQAWSPRHGANYALARPPKFGLPSPVLETLSQSEDTQIVGPVCPRAKKAPSLETLALSERRGPLPEGKNGATSKR
jgi:hypothetical protein